MSIASTVTSLERANAAYRAAQAAATPVARSGMCWTWVPGEYRPIGGNADDVKPERNALPGGRRADRACVYRMRSREPSVGAGAAAATRSRCQRKARTDRRPACPLSRAGGERADGSEGKLAVAR